MNDVFDGISHDSTFTYNERDQLTSRTDPNGNAWTSGYDASGNVTGFVDANGHATSIAYNVHGQPTVITDTTSGQTSFTYDPATGDLLSITDPDGSTRTFTYATGGQVLTAADGLGRTTTYTYTPQGQIRTRIDASGAPTAFTYDTGGNLITEARPEGVVTHDYDAAGQRTDLFDQTGHTHWDIDSLDRITAVTSPAGNITYAYNGYQRTGMTTSAATFAYGYDIAGRLNSVTGPEGTTTLTSTWAGTATIARPNGLTTTNSYDLGGRLTDIVHAGATGVLAEFHYGLDSNGNRTEVDQIVNGQAWTETYSHDDLDRLVAVNYSDSGQTTTYTYTPAGDRLTMTITGTANAGSTSYAYDDAHQLTGYSGPTGVRTLTYDSNGNQTTDGNGSTYHWNSQNQLVGVIGAAGTQSYQYNADGIRTQVNGISQLWDISSPLPLLINDGSTTQTYAGGTLLTQWAGGQAYFPLADALGSTRVVSNSGGSAVGVSNFDAYGALRTSTGQPSSFGFTGQQTDASGLLNLRGECTSLRMVAFFRRTRSFETDPNFGVARAWSRAT